MDYSGGTARRTFFVVVVVIDDARRNHAGAAHQATFHDLSGATGALLTIVSTGRKARGIIEVLARNCQTSQEVERRSRNLLSPISVSGCFQRMSNIPRDYLRYDALNRTFTTWESPRNVRYRPKRRCNSSCVGVGF